MSRDIPHQLDTSIYGGSGKGSVRQLDTRFGDHGKVGIQEYSKDKSELKMESLAQLTLQRELELVGEEEAGKGVRVCTFGPTIASFLLKSTCDNSMKIELISDFEFSYSFWIYNIITKYATFCYQYLL